MNKKIKYLKTPLPSEIESVKKIVCDHVINFKSGISKFQVT